MFMQFLAGLTSWQLMKSLFLRVSCHDLYSMCTLWHYLESNLKGYLKMYFSFEFGRTD